MRLIDADKLFDSLRGNVLVDVTPALEKAIETQPAVDVVTVKNAKWILVTDRLPDKPGDYWVAMRHLDGSVSTEKMSWYPDWSDEDAWNEVVIAWQPYYCPEPFVPQNLTGN